MKSLQVVVWLASCWMAAAGSAAEPLQIGSRLELFVDDHVVDRLEGDAVLQLH